MKANLYLILIIFITSLIGCIKPPDYPIEPEIQFLRFTKNTMNQGFLNEDSLLVTISFTDGDGDLGDHDSLNIFLTDTRTNFLQDRYRIPFIPEQGSSNGISGEISFILFNTCCIYQSSIPPCTPSERQPRDTLSYRIYIKDRAGNQSNEIETDPIFLRCN